MLAQTQTKDTDKRHRHRHRHSDRHLLVEAERRLVRPAARHVADGVPAPPHNHQRLAEALHELNTLAVTLYGQVERSEAVAD